MATWTMHLAIAKELEKKLNIIDKNEFYFGNIVPDLEKWVVPDLDIFVDYNDSHYAITTNNYKNPLIADLDKFYKINKEELIKQNPLIMGYYCHLIVDNYLNDKLGNNISVYNDNNEFIGIYLKNAEFLKCDKEKRRVLKHREYEMFNKYLIMNFKIESPILNDKLVNSTNTLKNIVLSKRDIEKIINKAKELINIDTFKDVKCEYEMYSEEILLEYYNDVIKYIIEVLKAKNLIK